jgi:anti-sigma regulatory factor (Ser/Thr protein kinase)
MDVCVKVATADTRASISEMLVDLDVREVADENEAAVQICDSVTRISDGLPAILLWQRGAPSDDVPFAYRDLRHLVSTTPELDHSALATTLEQVRAGGFITLSELLDEPFMSEGSETKTSRQKGILLARFDSFLQSTSIPEHQRNDLITHLEELLTNAIYNAPVQDGHHPNSALHRATPARSDRPVTITWAFDGSRAAVVVRDEYGSLAPDAVVECLYRCYRGPRADVQEKEGGAGLGLFTLMRLSSRLVVNIDPGCSTEVIAIRRMSDRRRPWPTLNICLPQ